MTDPILLSTVTPVYRGADTLPALVEHLAGLRDRLARGPLPLELCESIFVDDGSRDGSEEILRQLAARHPWIRVLTLSRNFGQHPATEAGILHSSGDWVATLDEDLQHDPAHLTALLREAVENGWDLCYARPTGAVHGTFGRDWTAKLYKYVLSLLAGNPNVRNFNSYRVVRGSVARAAASVAAHDTYFDVVLGWFVQRIGVLPLRLEDHRYAEAGASGYSFLGLLSHARRLFTTSQSKWLRIAAFIGLGSLVLSLLLMAFAVGSWFLDPSTTETRGWTSLFVTTLFFGGLLSCLLSILLEYHSSVLLHAQGKPTFFVVDRSLDIVLREAFSQEPRERPAPATPLTPAPGRPPAGRPVRSASAASSAAGTPARE